MRVGEFSPFLCGVLEAAREIAPKLLAREHALLERHTQGAGGDISIGADLLCEAIFVKHLSHIAHIDSEESGFIPAGTKADSSFVDSACAPFAHATPALPTIVLDPLDGSDNYLSGIPYYGASLALCDSAGQVQEAAVINYCSGEVFYDCVQILDSAPESNLAPNTKSSPQATLNFTALKLHFPTLAPLPLAHTSPKCGIFEKAYSNPTLAAKLRDRHCKFRSLGASALSLAYALEHEFFLFGGQIRRYDALAGLFLCRNLHILEHGDFLLVSQNKQVFGMIGQILEQRLENH